MVVNTQDLSFECTRMLHVSMLVPTLAYGNEMLVWKEKEELRIRSAQINSFVRMLGMKIDRV